MDYQEPIQKPEEEIAEEQLEGKDFVTGKPLPFFGNAVKPDPKMVAYTIQSTALSIFAMIIFVLITLFCTYILLFNLYISAEVRRGDDHSKAGTYFSAVTSYSDASRRAVKIEDRLHISKIILSSGRNTFVKYIENGEKYFGSQSALEHIEEHMSLDGLTDSRLLAVVKRAEADGEAEKLLEEIKKKYAGGDFDAFCLEVDKAKQEHPDYPSFMFDICKLETAAQTKQPDEKQMALFDSLYETSPEKINLYIGYGVRVLLRLGNNAQAIALCKGENANDGTITEMRLYICRMTEDYNKASGIYSTYRYKDSFVSNVDREALIVFLLKNNKSLILEMLNRYTLLEQLGDVDHKMLYTLEIAALDCGDKEYFNNLVSYLKVHNIPQSASVLGFQNGTLTKEAIFLDYDGEFG